MARVVGDIAVQVGADIGPLQKGMRAGARELDGFSERSKRMAANVAKAGIAVTAAVAGMAAGAYSMAKSAADAGAEIEQLSRLSGLAPERFQKMAIAARDVGIEQDKLADILKDVNDRVGDFLQTGGGPMADFFENIAPKVGVTAEQFRNLNSADALQLYVDSLERANLSQGEMTFFLEAMASDLTNLLPLLSDGGKEMDALGQAAEDAGRILSNDAVRGSTELKRELESLTDGIRTQFTQAILENKDEILNTWIPATIKVIEAIGGIVTVIGDVVSGINSMIEAYERFKRAADGTSFTAGPNRADRDRVMDEFGSSVGEGDPSQTGLHDYTDPFILEGLKGNKAQNNFLPQGMNFVSPQGELDADTERMAAHIGEVLSLMEEGNENRIQLISDARAREVEIESQTQQSKKGILEGSLNSVSSVLSSFSAMQDAQNKKDFEKQKNLQKASAVVAGVSAAVSAWQKGMQAGGPALAAAYTAASLARTGAMISQIDSASYSGGGSASGGGSGGGGETTRQVDINIAGGGEFIPRTAVTRLIEEINAAGQENGVRIRTV